MEKTCGSRDCSNAKETKSGEVRGGAVHQAGRSPGQYVNRFGAAHFSKGFALTGDNQTPKEKRAFLMRISQMPENANLAWYKEEWVTNAQFLDYFLMPVWKRLKTLFKEKQTMLHTEIVRSIGGEQPGQGLSNICRLWRWPCRSGMSR